MIGRGRDLSLVRDELTLTVKATSPQRLDHYVLRSLDWKSRTRIQKLIREGYIRVNDEPAKPSRRVRCRGRAGGESRGLHALCGSEYGRRYVNTHLRNQQYRHLGLNAWRERGEHQRYQRRRLFRQDATGDHGGCRRQGSDGFPPSRND